MRADVITLFPEMFQALDHSIPSKAKKAGVFDLRLHNLRDFPINRYGAVDDYPYGGEPGMVLHPQPLQQSLEKALEGREGVPVLYPCPHGKPLTQDDVRKWSEVPELILVCGHYKGIDERFRYLHVTHEFSVGDYVLSGGEMASLVFLDAVTRLLPGVLGDEGSARTDSFEEPLLGWPVYTRPELWNGLKVPDALLSGNHERIRQWKRRLQLLWTRERRPDLWEKHKLTQDDRKILGADQPEAIDEDLESLKAAARRHFRSLPPDAFDPKENRLDG